MKLTYESSGVDTEKADDVLGEFGKFLKGRPKDPNLLSGIGPYAAAYSLKSLLHGMSDPLLVASCDGVGTKAKLALDWNNINTLGEDLVAMNVNDLLCMGATPLLFLDYFASGKLEKEQLLTLLQSIQQGCELAGCVIAGGETAEMPGLYTGKDFDLAGFAIGFVDRGKMLGAEKVRPGDRLLGIESSGIHSNGYSLIRKIVETKKLNPNDQTPFSKKTWSEVLLAPTTIYVKAIAPSLEDLSALSHITGSGLFGNLPRVLPPHTKAVIHQKNWPRVPLFQWLMETAKCDEREMLGIFNGGIGMIAIVPEKKWDQVESKINRAPLKIYPLGVIEKASEEEPFVEWVK